MYYKPLIKFCEGAERPAKIAVGDFIYFIKEFTFSSHGLFLGR
jgi:hypothetical protein